MVDSPYNGQAQVWWFLDTLDVEHRCAPGMETVVLQNVGDRRARILLVHDNASFRDLIGDLGTRAEAHVYW